MQNPVDLQCDKELRRRIEANLKGFSVREIKNPQARRAAVALVVVEYDRDEDVYGMSTDGLPDRAAALILTFRTSRHQSHLAMAHGIQTDRH